MFGRLQCQWWLVYGMWGYVWILFKKNYGNGLESVLEKNRRDRNEKSGRKVNF